MTVSLPAVLEHFECVPFGARLTVASCTGRHARATAELRGRGKKGAPHLVGGKRCADCSVGCAHVKGERPATWADGAPVERSSLPLEPGTSRWLAKEARSPQRAETGRAHRATLGVPDAVTGGGRALVEGGGEHEGGEAGAARALADPKPLQPSAAPVADNGPPAPSIKPEGAEGDRAPPHASEPEAQAVDGEGVPEKGRGERAPTTTTEARVSEDKGCVDCGASFQPSSNRQKRCTDCGAKRRSRKPSKKTSAATDSAIDPRLTGALELLDEERQVLLSQLAELELTANRLAARAGVAPPYGEPA